MNAMSTSLKTFLLFALLALGVEYAFGQIVDPNPPVVCEGENDDGSYIEFSGTFQSPEGEIKGRLEWGDVKEWMDTLLGWLGGGGNDSGGEAPPDGGEAPPDGGEAPPGGEGEGGDPEGNESSGAPDCSTVLQKLHYARVEIAGSSLVVATARGSDLKIAEVHLTRPIALPPRVKQRAGLKGNWFIKPGTYPATGRIISLPLVKRKQ